MHFVFIRVRQNISFPSLQPPVDYKYKSDGPSVRARIWGFSVAITVLIPSFFVRLLFVATFLISPATSKISNSPGLEEMKNS